MKKTLEKVCKDKNGKWTIVQTPNIPITVWLVCVVASKLAEGEISRNISTVGTLFLSIWAYLEIAYGDSIFRKILGLVVLIFIVINTFS
jgi:hypothetical protein